MNGILNNVQTQQPQLNMWGRIAAPHYETPLVHGRQGAEQFNIGPNSSIYLPDADDDYIWWIRTDNYGNKNIICLDVTIHVDPPQVDLNNLQMRLEALEEKLNAKQNKSNTKRNNATDAETTANKQSVS